MPATGDQSVPVLCSMSLPASPYCHQLQLSSIYQDAQLESSTLTEKRTTPPLFDRIPENLQGSAHSQLNHSPAQAARFGFFISHSE